MEGYYGNEEASFKHAVNSCRSTRTELFGGTGCTSVYIALVLLSIEMAFQIYNVERHRGHAKHAECRGKRGG